MLNCNSYLNNQLSKAYEAAKKVITSADIEKEYIRKAKAGSQAARDALFNLYIPLVISSARSRNYEMYTGEMGDLISAAAIGFNRALELFDTSLGYEFGCFYKWHIKNAMNKLGFRCGHCRLPLTTMTEEGEAKLDALLKKHGMI